MDKPMLAVVILLILSIGAVLSIPAGSPVPGADTTLNNVPREDNGIVGRFLEGMADLYWNPFQMVVVFTVSLISLSGLLVYWRHIQD
jgi:hypothetical protein